MSIRIIINWLHGLLLTSSGYVLGVIGIVTVAGIIVMDKPQFNSSIEIWFDPGERLIEDYNNFLKKFGTDAYITILYEDDSLFSKDQIELNKSLTEEIAALNNIKQVLSLTSIKVLDGNILSGEWSYLLHADSGNVSEARDLILSEPIFIDNIISSNGKATAISVALENDSIPYRFESLDDIKSILGEPEFEFMDFYVIGNIPITYAMNSIVKTESGKYLLLSVIIFYILLLITIKNYKVSSLPIIVGLILIIWVFSLYNLFGHSINMISGLIPLILFILNMAISIHIVVRFTHEINSGNSIKDSLFSTLNKLFVPCLFSCLTTAVAFLSFTFTNLLPTIVFGYFVSIGALLVFILNFTLLPILLMYAYKPKSRKVKPFYSISRPSFNSLVTFIRRNNIKIISISIIVLVLAILGITKLEIETDQLKHLKKSHPVRVSSEKAQEWFNGVFPIEVVISTDSEEGASTEEMFELLPELEESLIKIEAIENIHSPLSLISSISRLLGQKDVNNYQVWRLLNMPESDETATLLNNYIHPTGKDIRLSLRTRFMNIEKMGAVLSDINLSLDSLLIDSNTSWAVTGIIPLYYNISKRLTSSQVTSIYISFILVLIMILVLFRNLGISLLSLIPNVLPIITTMGIMGWVGTPLDVGSILIAAISLGITIDDTIHFIYAYRRSSSKQSNPTKLFREVFEIVGFPISLTTLVVCLGFSVLIFSSYRPLIYFGIFVSLNVFFALLYDFLLLPSILFIRHKQLLKKETSFRENYK